MTHILSSAQCVKPQEAYVNNKHLSVFIKCNTVLSRYILVHYDNNIIKNSEYFFAYLISSLKQTHMSLK